MKPGRAKRKYSPAEVKSGWIVAQKNDKLRIYSISTARIAR